MGGSSDRVGKKGKTLCAGCDKKCSGEALKVHDRFFHIGCFKCKECDQSLAHGGFFSKLDAYYCTADYQRLFGARCAVCERYVEGEVVTALGRTYHQNCFRCARCRQSFPAGERVTFTGKECLCGQCALSPAPCSTTNDRETTPTVVSKQRCAGCSEELNDSQALIALDLPWHLSCFKCSSCHAPLHGEYMARDGRPYCEKHYQSEYGVRCAYCQRYISGKVLQAGDNHHFHPTCARCTKCGSPFGDGEEMYLQGAAIWHPRCGPCPSDSAGGGGGGDTTSGHPVNGQDLDVDLDRSTELDRFSTTASEAQFSYRSISCTPNFADSYTLGPPYHSGFRKYSGYRSASPGTMLRAESRYGGGGCTPALDITRIYTHSYLVDMPSSGYLRRPIEPYDKPPKSPHFHHPPNGVPRSGRRSHSQRPSSRSAMQALVDHMETGTPRPRSPYMNNEEPIELSHFPDAKRPVPHEQAPIERDDFPAPPYPYTDPERRRRLSEKSSVHDADEQELLEQNGDEEHQPSSDPADHKLMREEAELNKIASGIGKVFLQQVRERDKLRRWRLAHVDPRSLSRAPNADRELPYRLRYHSPLYASPSRDTEHLRPWELDDDFERGSTYRSSLPGRAYGATPSYRTVTQSPRSCSWSRQDAGRSATLPATRDGLLGQTSRAPTHNSIPYGEFSSSYTALDEKTHSVEFSSARSDVSNASLTEADRNALNQAERVSMSHTPRTPATAPIPTSGAPTSDGGPLRFSYMSYLRRSLPSVLNSSSLHAPPPPLPASKLYPAHLLFTTNYRLPGDVDRNNLEHHLADAEFELVFHVCRADFYRLPVWRRNELKKRVRLF